MTGLPDLKPPTGPDPTNGAGLSLRLWLGCLGAWFVVSAGIVWILSASSTGSEAQVRALWLPVAVVIVLGLLAAIGLAAWLSSGIVSRVRSLATGISAGQIVDQDGRPWPGGWGEIGDLGLRIQALLTRQRHLHWTADELTRLQRQVATTHEAVQRWMDSERWEVLVLEDGPVRPLADALNRGLARNRDVLEQNQEAARQVRADLLACLEEARQSADQAERGFVETTALLESIQEMQKLAGDLRDAVEVEPADAEEPAVRQWRLQATTAIEELVSASNESISHLASGFLRVQEIGEQVHVLSNRAALIALNTLLDTTEEQGSVRQPVIGELKQLAREVRDATSRVTDLSADIEREVDQATEKMRGMRDRVAQRLGEVPPEEEDGSAPLEDLDRALERAREVSEEAVRRGERLQATGDRVSRAVQGVVRRLELEVRDVEGLVVRLTPTGTPEPGAGGGGDRR